MLREDIKAKPNPCENIIHITYYGKDKRSDSINLLKELKAKFPDMYGDFPDDEIYTDLDFTSEWVSPLQFLQHLCNKYTVDIIGVAYEFIDGYVESFELKNELIEEVPAQTALHLIELKDLEEITELPKAQDDEFLDAECPADLDPDRLDLSDEEILKSFL